MQMAKSRDWSRCEVRPGRIPLRRHSPKLTTKLRCFWCERNDHQKTWWILRLSLGFTVSAKCVKHSTNNSLLIKRLSSSMKRQWLAVPLLWGLHRTLLICISNRSYSYTTDGNTDVTASCGFRFLNRQYSCDLFPSIYLYSSQIGINGSI